MPPEQPRQTTGLGVEKIYKGMFDAFGVTIKTIKSVGDLPITMTFNGGY
jgi:hypothetical protein